MSDEPRQYTFHIRAHTVNGQFKIVPVIATDNDAAREKFAKIYPSLTFLSFWTKRGRK